MRPLRAACWFAAALAPLLAGCADAPARRPDERLIAEPPPPAAAPVQLASSGEAPVAAASAAPGQIRRAEFERVLAQSPAILLRSLDPEPAFELSPRGRRFLGWRLRSFFPDDPRFAAAALRAGDVVTRVNGKNVERPEQFIEVWQAAKAKNDLTVEILRDGKSRTVRWAIVQ
jgi:S1-C subfamily serine protease